MKFLILPDRDTAEKISRRLWDTAHNERNPVTVRACGVIEHKDGRAALRWPEGFRLRPHPSKDASAEISRDLSKYSVDLIAKVEARKGSEHPFEDFIPDSIKSRIATEKDLVADGWPIGDNIDP